MSGRQIPLQTTKWTLVPGVGLTSPTEVPLSRLSVDEPARLNVQVVSIVRETQTAPELFLSLELRESGSLVKL